MPTVPAAYARLEALHVRQVLQRAVPVLGALALNGAGWLDLSWLPRPREALSGLGTSRALDTGFVLTGAALILLAVCLRTASKGVLVRKRTVTDCGVYRRVRHPYYLANLTGCAGVLLLAGVAGAPAAALWLAAAVPVFLVTISAEEEGLRALHGDVWAAYASRVPRLVPSLRLRPPGDRGRITWDALMDENEPPRLCRFVAGALAVASCRFEGAPAWSLGGAAAAAFVASHVISLTSRSSR